VFSVNSFQFCNFVELIPPSSTLYVGNLSTGTSVPMLKEAFKECIDAKILWANGKTKG